MRFEQKSLLVIWATDSVLWTILQLLSLTSFASREDSCVHMNLISLSLPASRTLKYLVNFGKITEEILLCTGSLVKVVVCSCSRGFGKMHRVDGGHVREMATKLWRGGVVEVLELCNMSVYVFPCPRKCFPTRLSVNSIVFCFTVICIQTENFPRCCISGLEVGSWLCLSNTLWLSYPATKSDVSVSGNLSTNTATNK